MDKIVHLQIWGGKLGIIRDRISSNLFKLNIK